MKITDSRFLTILSVLTAALYTFFLLSPLGRNFASQAPMINYSIVGITFVGLFLGFFFLFQVGRESALLQGRGLNASPSEYKVGSTFMHWLQSSPNQEELSEQIEYISAYSERRSTFLEFLVSILVVAGLLGTFIGLMATIGQLDVLFANFTTMIGSSDSQAAITRLAGGLQDLVGGMGIAFSSSLFGISGSIIVGLVYTTGRVRLTGLLREFENLARQHIRSVDVSDKRATAEVLGDYAKAFEKFSELVELLRDEKDGTAEALRVIADNSSLTADNSSLTSQKISSLHGAIGDLAVAVGESHKDSIKAVSVMSGAISNLESSLSESLSLLSNIEGSFRSYSAKATVDREKSIASLSDTTSTLDRFLAESLSLLSNIEGSFRSYSAKATVDRERSIANLSDTTSTLDHFLAKMDQHSGRLVDAVEGLHVAVGSRRHCSDPEKARSLKD